MNIIPKSFEFVSYDFQPKKKKIYFKYRINFENQNPLVFTETIVLPRVPKLSMLPEGLIQTALQSVHLILGTSYYKLYCPKEVVVPYSLNEDQAKFWNTVYRKGFGEFYYNNKFPLSRAPVFAFEKNYQPTPYPMPRHRRSLVGVGGGKDSIVACEMLKEAKEDVTAFVVETQKPTKIITDVTKEMAVPTVIIKRLLDDKIFTSFPESYNGHIPVSAVFAFLGYLASLFYGYDYFIVANEYSSNFGNTKYEGEDINHQWSKSGEFEALFQNYSRLCMTPDVVYFSALRQFYEIKIVKMFSKYKNYFPYFSSCNASFKVNKKRPGKLWCGECPKCAFIFTLLSAFIPKKELLAIFGKNLFQDKELVPVFADILGFGSVKPFDCVGTFGEAQAALRLARRKFRNDLAVRTFVPKITITPEMQSAVFQAHPVGTIPPKFAFLGARNVLIVGYGKEGKVTHRYLKKKYPKLKIGIADQQFNSDYLKKQTGYDTAVKTPGLPGENMSIPYTTATNLFFSQMKERGNTIIGVTGSKGKSTTASLIYSVLKAAGYDAKLLGNIGIPMLSAILKRTNKKTIFVVELSSYQLSDIRFSPDVAVVTNLFPEHMNYHGSIEKYYEAKKNIINFQDNSDTFIFNPANDLLVKWSQCAASNAIPFAVNLPFSDQDIPLIGEHNRENLKASVAVARIFGLSDQVIRQAVKSFKPLSHRLEKVGEFRGITFYDDANATTPQAAILAIKSIPGVQTIFLGGQDRGYDFSQLEKVIRDYGIRNVVLFPDSGKRILLSRKGLNVLETTKMEEAVRFAYGNTPAGSVCLLSCASPSYSLWKNFEEKGDDFQRWARELGRE